MRCCKQLALGRYNRQACDLDVGHTWRGERPTRRAAGKPEYAEVVRRVEITGDVVVGDARHRDVAEVV